MRITVVRTALAFCAVALALVGCGGSAAPPANPPVMQAGARLHSATTPIQHVVLLIQENRSFNDFFATFPGADGTTTGQTVANPNCSPPIKAGPIALTKMPLNLTQDLNHSWKTGYSIAYDGGKLDAFDLVKFDAGAGSYECSYPYQYTDPSQIQPYVTLATEYTLAEHMYTTQGSDSFTAHQDLIRGGTIVEKNKAMVDLPNCGNCWWGCDAPSGVITHLITSGNQPVKKKGPFPCSNRFAEKYDTMRDLLDAKSVSWKYYVPPSNQIYGKLLSAFDVIHAVRYGPEWNTNISTPETNILNDVTSGTLPAVSWVVPEAANSDHPGTLVSGKYVDNGPEWIASVVNAIGESPYWNSTAIVIVWDDWGGLYDNNAASMSKYGGPGERVPALIVSPYARPGHISTTVYQFGSILKYIEQNWHLGSLGTTDVKVKSIIDCFDYKQSPIKFRPISSSLGKAYFLHEKHSYQAPDSDW